MTTAREMPRYQSHKKVWALEIERVDPANGAGRVISFRDAGYAPTEIPEDTFARYQPGPGDFYVVYADGYQSFSPRKAFLDGYSKSPS